MGNISCGLRRTRRREKEIHTTESENTSSNDKIPSPLTGSTQSGDIQPDPEVRESDLSAYNIWYRHLGEDLPSGDCFDHRYDCQNKSTKEILEDVGEHYITHMCINGGLSPPINDVAPNLTHLYIIGMDDHSQLERLLSLVGVLDSLTEIHLTCCTLTDLPEKKLEQLKVLHLTDTYLPSGLPSVIGNLKSLTELHINHCRLTDLPENLGKLRKLRVLHLRNNDFSDGLPIVIGKLTSLTKLRIEGCQLTHLPENFRELSYLADSNFKGGLPDVIEELSSLTELHIRGCRLAYLPETLGRLQQLEVLDLENNYFVDGLPDVIAQLSSLIELNLQNCSLTELPQSFGKLQQLEVLHLGLNTFQNGLPDSLGKLNSLTQLYLQSCGLNELPQSMSELKQLKILELRENYFSKGLPEVILKLTSLTELTLKTCDLASLPPWFGELQKLEVLNLWNNYFFPSGLPDVVGELNSLSELHLQNCCLSDLPPRFGELQQLKVLHLRSNRFKGGLPEVIGELTSLTELHLEECSLKDLPPRFGQLQQLKLLFLEKNNFTSGCPEVIGELNSLAELHLQECSLTDLPQSLDNLHQLHELDLKKNKIQRVPPVIYELEELENLKLNYNSELVEMDKGILQLKKLQQIDLFGTSLRPPLGDVARQGLEMIKKYFTGCEQKAVVSTIPVAVIGEAFSGKTCIAKSLINQKREISNRPSPLEDATEIFKVETLKLETSEVNLIDFGGQDIYHVAYQLALKETCVPLVVVNIARYKELIKEVRSEQEATKRLCMEWLCHLYVAQPTLDRPMLALTHVDKLSPTSSREEFKKLKDTLLQNAEKIQEKWLKREQFLGTNQNSENILCIKRMKFSAENIFEFTDKDESSDVKALTTRIKSRCVSKIPKNWNDVGDFLKYLQKPYIELSDVTKKFPDCRDILQYLHHTGTILWFEKKKELENYVFHHTQAVTRMVALLFPLDKGKMKTGCIESFSGFFHKGKEIGIATYKQLLDNYLYNTTGMIDEALLCNRVKTQTEFEFPIAVELLKCFRIIHGPIKLKDDSSPRTVYLVPSFIKKSLDKPWETPGKHKLQLRFDLIFNGLPLPEHAYQLMTVEVLNLKKEDEHVEAYSNGAEVQHDENCSTYLVHDYYTQKVTLQVSTNVESLKESWDRLKRATKALTSWLKEEWPTCLVELETYCAHCLFRKDPAPGSLPNPIWYTTDETEPQLLKLRKCLKSNSKGLVPTAFLMPCAAPDSKQIAKLKSYLTKWQPDVFDADASRK